MANSHLGFSVGCVHYASADDYVRAQYAGVEARRKLSEITPSLLKEVLGFVESERPANPKSVKAWLASRGTWGAVDNLVKEILRLRPVAIAAKVV